MVSRFFICRCYYLWLCLILIVLLGALTGASAHKLSVFAWVEGDLVKVEGKLHSGKRPKQGTLRVYDGENRLLLEKTIQPNGTAAFPLKNWETGLKVVIDIGEGHQSYWILTPFDIRQQQKDAVHETK